MDFAYMDEAYYKYQQQEDLNYNSRAFWREPASEENMSSKPRRRFETEFKKWKIYRDFDLRSVLRDFETQKNCRREFFSRFGVSPEQFVSSIGPLPDEYRVQRWVIWKEPVNGVVREYCMFFCSKDPSVELKDVRDWKRRYGAYKADSMMRYLLLIVMLGDGPRFWEEGAWDPNDFMRVVILQMYLSTLLKRGLNNFKQQLDLNDDFSSKGITDEQKESLNEL